MKVVFITNYRLDLAVNRNGRQVELTIPEGEQLQTKDQFLLQFCGQIHLLWDSCIFYKEAHVMAPFLERPVRLKYMIKFPNNSCVVLDAVLQSTELREKAKELKDHFDLATENNKTEMKIDYPVLLTLNYQIGVKMLEKEYNILILSTANAIKLFKQIIENG